MYVDADVTHIRHLILSEKIEEARTALHDLLQSNPYHDQAWTLAAQFTSDPEQRKIFIKRVFDCSNNMELADWAFQNFGKLEMGLESEIPVPPVDYLAVQKHRKIPLVQLIDLALNPPERKPQPLPRPVSPPEPQPVPMQTPKPLETIAPVLQSVENQNKDNPFKSSNAVNEPLIESTMPLFSVKAIGKWIILGAGLFFICIVYMPSLNYFFLRLGFPPFYFCVLPLFFFGIATTIAGYFLEKK